MTYGRALYFAAHRTITGAAASHLAELVRGNVPVQGGPLIRPSGTFSPRGEGFPLALNSNSFCTRVPDRSLPTVPALRDDG